MRRSNDGRHDGGGGGGGGGGSGGNDVAATADSNKNRVAGCCWIALRRQGRRRHPPVRKSSSSSSSPPTAPSSSLCQRLSSGRSFALRSFLVWVLLCWPGCVVTVAMILAGGGPKEGENKVEGGGESEKIDDNIDYVANSISQPISLACLVLTPEQVLK